MKNEDVVDKMFDILLDEVVKQYNSKPEIDLPEETTVEFSERHERNMRKLFARERRKNMRNQIITCTRHIAACIALLVIISGITVMSVSALRVKIMNYVFNTHETNTDISLEETDDSDAYGVDGVNIEYIPAGFALIKQNITDNTGQFVFSNGIEQFNIAIYGSNGRTSINTENADCEELDINGFNAVYSENGDVHILNVYNENYTCTIVGGLNRAEFIKIAQNLK